MYNINYTKMFLLLLIFIMSTVDVKAQTNYCTNNNPCKNGGTCVPQDQAGLFYRYSCKCTPSWTGMNCDTQASKGSGFISGGTGGISGEGWSSGGGSSNGGSSNNNWGGGGSNTGGSGGSFIDNFSDKKNLKPTDPCYSNPCYNNGRCESIDKYKYRCVACANGYSGPNCQNRSSSNNQPSMKPNKKSLLAYILGTVLPILVIVALICLCIYCCCYRKGDSSGFMSKFTQLPSEFGVDKSRQIYTKSVNQMEDPDEAFKAHPPYQPPK